MSTEQGKKTTPSQALMEDDEIALEVRRMIRRALKGALATLDARSGHPYASLVTVATEPDGRPTFLLSSLALHTRNLEADPRASLLIDATDGQGDPMTGARITLSGRMVKTDSASARARFLTRHQEAALYADFADFAFWRLDAAHAHLVGGFGRIVDIAGSRLRIDVSGAEALIKAHVEIVRHMNEDHADSVRLYATRLAGQPEGEWRFVGCDPEGIDLLAGERSARVELGARISTPTGMRKALVSLSQKARARTPGG